MKHIFLTGQVQCGKSTLIRRVLAALGPLSLGGFRSISVASAIPGAFAEVYLVPAADEYPALTRDNLIGIRWGGHGFNAYPAAFDNYGVQLLRSSAPAQLLLMDELGMMENAATLFAQAVSQCLDGAIPILGVVKPRSTPLLDTVRAHPAVKVITVDENNRDSLVPVVTELLRPLIK